MTKLVIKPIFVLPQKNYEEDIFTTRDRMKILFIALKFIFLSILWLRSLK